VTVVVQRVVYSGQQQQQQRQQLVVGVNVTASADAFGQGSKLTHAAKPRSYVT
jgi:hypothetical protein